MRDMTSKIERELDLRHKGNAAMLKKQYAEALTHFTEAIELNPIPLLYSNRSQASFMLGDYTRAVADASTAIEIDDQFTKAFTRRAQAYCKLGKYKEASEDYLICKQRNPTDKEICQLYDTTLEKAELLSRADSLKAEGNRHISHKEFQKAIEKYTQSLDLVESAPVMCNRAMAYLKLDRNDEAISDACKALNLDPTFIKAYHRRASAYLALKEWQKAREDFAKILELDPTLKTECQASIDKCDSKLNKEKKLEEVSGPEKLKAHSKIMTHEDYQAKQAQQEAFLTVLESVDRSKCTAMDFFKKAKYQDAIHYFSQAASQLDQSLSQFSLFKKEIAQMEATIFSNLAHCSGKLSKTHDEITYCSYVIERSLYLEDMTQLAKTYLRRGLAYEAIQKSQESIQDCKRVLELSPQNKQAAEAIQRCYLRLRLDKEEQRQEQQQEVDELPQLDGVTPAEELFEEAKAKKIARKEARKKKLQPKPEEPLTEEEILQFNELDTKLTALKDLGNTKFAQKQYGEAITYFTRGIDVYHSVGAPLRSPEVKTRIAQLLTNRALCHFYLQKHTEVIDDCSYVLKHLDSKNVKALFRRSQSFKSLEKWSDALMDLDVLISVDPTEQVKKDVKFCFTKYTDQKKAQAAKKEDTKMEIEEASNSSDSDDAPKPVVQPKKPSLDQSIVARAKQLALDKQRQLIFDSDPTSAAQFEHNFLALTSSTDRQDFCRLKTSNFAQLFSKTQLDYDVFIKIVSVLPDQEAWAQEVLEKIGKSYNFDLTLMLMDEKDSQTVSKAVKNCAKAIQQLYK